MPEPSASVERGNASKRPARALRSVALVAISVLIASLARWALGPLVEEGIPYVLYLAAVAASSRWGGLRAGVLAAGLSVLVGSFLFASPIGNLWIEKPRDLASAAAFLGASAVVLLILEAEKRSRHRALEHESRLHAERESRLKLEAELAEAHRLESLGRLAGGVAHDFNNLLTVIIGSCEILRRDRTDPDSLSAIELAGRRGAGLTRQLLGLAQRQMMELRAISPNEIINESLQLVRTLLPDDVRIEKELHPDPWLFDADPTQMQQLVLNLVTNARDALGEGGTITIKTDNVTLDQRFARTRPEVTPGEYVLMRVSDTGAGMTPALQSQIFEPFFTTKKNHGTGLGLAVVYGVVKQLGGHIFVRSAPGQGSTFDVYWPRRHPQATSTPEQSEELCAQRAMTILLAEDNDLVRRTAAQMLRKLGHTVIEASNGAEALTVSRNHPGPIDVLVTDVVMPWLNGRELAEHLQSERSGLGVVFVSGYTDNVILQRGIVKPGVVLLRKPFSSEQMDLALRRVTAPMLKTG